MKKYITRIYRSDSIDSIEKADQEHMRLINLGYKVNKTYDFLFSCPNELRTHFLISFHIYRLTRYYLVNTSFLLEMSEKT